MNNQFLIPRGTSDILPAMIPAWESIEQNARKIFKIFGYSEIRTPLYEDIGLFRRSLGQTSDVVHKQLLEVVARRNAGEEGEIKESELALRPEGTAAVIRSYIENRFDAREGLSKLFYIGPMFRGERPQKGRLRQFHQIGAEAIGPLSASPFLDAEMIALAVRLLKDFGVAKYQVKLNTLGTREDKENFSKILRDQLRNRFKDLCVDCQGRFERNIFRVLDCKNVNCQNIVDSFQFNDQHLAVASREYYAQVREALLALNIPFTHSPKLVRGLDYYTHTIFEIVGDGLGSQDALGAGGRYNNLVEELGGPAADSVGFALGVERILLAVSEDQQKNSEPLNVFMVALGESAFRHAFLIMDLLRKNGIACDMLHSPNGSMKSQMRRADKLKAQYVLILGDEEEKNQTIIVKNMAGGEQEVVKISAVVEYLIKRIIQKS